MKREPSHSWLKKLAIFALLASYSSVAYQYYRIARARHDIVTMTAELKQATAEYHSVFGELKQRHISPPAPSFHGADDKDDDE